MAAFRYSGRRWKGGVSTASAAVAVLLAGIAPQVAAEGWYGAPPPVDYGDKGALRLQLGQTAYPGTTAFPNAIHKPVPPRFVYETAGRPQRTSFTQPHDQSFVLNGKCGGALDPTVPQLATMASGPDPNALGFGPDSIGVYDGPKGVACYRITAAIGESIRFDLGPGLRSLTAARSFYRLASTSRSSRARRSGPARRDPIPVLCGTAQFGIDTSNLIAASCSGAMP